MLPGWIRKKFESCELLAFDDENQIAYVQMDMDVFELDYRYIEQQACNELGQVSELQLRCMLTANGKKIWDWEKRPLS